MTSITLGPQFARLLAGERDEYTIEKRLRRSDGHTVWARIGASVVRDDAANLCTRSVSSSIRPKPMRSPSNSRTAASHDHLTGLASRRVLDDHLQRTRARAARSGDVVAVLAVDLDGFKQINDRFGHLAGDNVLVEVARRLESVVRADDLIVRYGGDEFIIVLSPGADVDLIKTIAQRVVDALAEPMDVLGTTTRIGASVGIATVPHDTHDGADVLAQADVATYEAKQRGRGRYVFFDELNRITRPT